MRQLIIVFSLFFSVFSANADFDRFEYFTAPKLLILTNVTGEKSYEFILPAPPLYIDYTWIQVGPQKFVTFVGFTFVSTGSLDRDKKFEHQLYRLVDGCRTIPNHMTPSESYVPEEFDPFKMLQTMGLPMEHKLTKGVGECADEDIVKIPYLKSLMGVIPISQNNVEQKIIKGQLAPNVPEYHRLYDLYEALYPPEIDKEEEEHIQLSQGQESIMGNLSSSLVGTLTNLFTSRSPAPLPSLPIQDEATLELVHMYNQLEAQISAAAKTQAESAWGPKTSKALQDITKKSD